MCYACCMGTLSAYQSHDLSGCLTDTLYQFLLIHYLLSCKSRTSRKICNVCSPMSLQGQMLRCAHNAVLLLNFTKAVLETSCSPPKRCWIEYLAWGIIVVQTSINLNQHSKGKVERGCFCSCFPLQEKKGSSYLSCTGVKRASGFSLLPQTKPAKDSGCWGLHFGGVYVLVTELLENSSAKLICCYQSTQWHKQVSADHSALNTDGSWSVYTKVMVHNRFSLQHVDTCLIQNVFVKYSTLHCAKLAMYELNRQGGLALISCLQMT